MGCNGHPRDSSILTDTVLIHTVIRVFDPILGLATGVMAYFLWENDPRNSHERPRGRSLPELVQRRLANQDPPADIFAGPEATQRSLFHIPSASRE